jgi:hypothetical protein
MPRPRGVIAFFAGAIMPLILVLLIVETCRGSDFCPAPHLVLGPIIGLGGGALAALAMARSGRGWLGLGVAAAGLVVGAATTAVIFAAPHAALDVLFVLGPPILAGLGIGYFLVRPLVRAGRGSPADVPPRSTEADA